MAATAQLVNAFTVEGFEPSMGVFACLAVPSVEWRKRQKNFRLFPFQNQIVLDGKQKRVDLHSFARRPCKHILGRPRPRGKSDAPDAGSRQEFVAESAIRISDGDGGPKSGLVLSGVSHKTNPPLAIKARSNPRLRARVKVKRWWMLIEMFSRARAPMSLVVRWAPFFKKQRTVVVAALASAGADRLLFGFLRFPYAAAIPRTGISAPLAHHPFTNVVGRATNGTGARTDFQSILGFHRGTIN
jgi:hypothetical protein